MEPSPRETTIHPTAIVEPGVQVGHGVEVGAYAFLGAGVVLGDGCRLHHHACVEGRTELGAGCEVFPFAVIGGKTHDLKFRGGEPGLRIGQRCVFREYVTIHRATADGQFTTVGDHCHVLAYSHIAHDCQVGHHLVMSSHSALGGHVEVGHHVNIGWGVGIHQFVRLGDHAMIGACSKAVQDIPPYFLADGNPATVRFLNQVGLERHGFTVEERSALKAAYKILYRENLNRADALTQLRAHPAAPTPTFQNLIHFVETSTRGLA